MKTKTNKTETTEKSNDTKGPACRAWSLRIRPFSFWLSTKRTGDVEDEFREPSFRTKSTRVLCSGIPRQNAISSGAMRPILVSLA